MKNIALVSFYLSENYGAVLQAFALHKALDDLGSSPVYLEYTKKNRLRGFALFKNRLNNIARFFFGYKLRDQRFRAFVEENIPHCDHQKAEFDSYIIGSDQVWHPDYLQDSDGFFFLPFVKSKPIYSYASSFGVSAIPADKNEYYKINLDRLSKIGVRESSGLQILNGLGMTGFLNLDPTLLLDEQRWTPYIAPRIEPHPYIFCYILQGDYEVAHYVNKMAKSLRKALGNKHKIVVMGDKEFKSIIPGYNLVCDAGPGEYLSYIKHADYIITSSFHGTCFSVNFNKPLKIVLRRSNKVNSRIIDLLSLVGLSHIVSYTDESVMSASFPVIDYDDANLRLKEQRAQSIEYLQSIIRDE